MRLLRGFQANPANLYVGLRGSALIFSFLLSLLYSNALGLESKSVLTFVFAWATTLIFGFISSFALSFRKQVFKAVHNWSMIIDYIKKAILLSLTLLVAFFTGLLIYSETVTPINSTLFAITGLLFISYALVQTLNELLLALDRLRAIGWIENLEVFFQIALFLLLYNFSTFSVIVTVMITFSITYLTSSIFIFVYVKSSFRKLLWKSSAETSTRYLKLEMFEKDSISTLLPTVLLDRLDRLIVGLVLPLSVLSQYAFLIAYFSIIRFIPEAISKLFFSSHLKSSLFRNVKWVLLILSALMVISYLLYVWGTPLILDKNWLLPLEVFIAVGIFEIIRSTYILKTNSDFYHSKPVANFSRILIMLIISSILSILLSISIGILAVPLSFATAYSVFLFKDLVRKKTKYVNP